MNAGVVSAASGSGVSLASSGIVGNTGSISGKDAVVLQAGGSVTNASGASILGLGKGIPDQTAQLIFNTDRYVGRDASSEKTIEGIQ